MAETEPYENTLSIDELRRELRYSLDVQYGVLHALRELSDSARSVPQSALTSHQGCSRVAPVTNRAGKMPQPPEKGQP
jgi:hypothetical protein